MINTFINLQELKERGCIVFQAETHPVAIFYTDGNIYAVDNRCPHMGFPLERGTVKDGILTCFWHYARFDLAGGGALDLFADDVRSFPVEARNGQIWIDLAPLPREQQQERLRQRLQHGLERDLNLVLAKAVIATIKELPAQPGDRRSTRGAAARLPFALGLEFGALNRRDGWAMGQTIHVAMMNLLPFLDEEDSARALYHGLSAVARDCDGAPARHVLEPLPGSAPNLTTLSKWFRRFIEVRDEEGAERCIVSAVQLGATPAQMTDLLLRAATDHRYIQIGHSADFANKAIEAWNHLSASNSDRVSGGNHVALRASLLASLTPSFANASRSEESNAWRNPIDLVELLEQAFERLPSVVDGARQAQDAPTVAPVQDAVRLAQTLLSDKPHDIVASLLEALQMGTSMQQLAAVVSHAAALRMARFHTSNEFGDWDTVLHTFTFANAIHQAIRRAPSIGLLRGVFDAAMSVYLDRFLNMPAAKIPQPAKSSEAPDELLSEFITLLDRQQQVNEAGALCAQYLVNGGEPKRLMATMGKALLREDPDFHTIQTLEAAFAQYQLWRGTPQAPDFLIAAARYLAAHAPTSRAMEQTFRIAWRLHRGDRLFEEE